MCRWASLLAGLLIACATAQVAAQESVTIRQINAIPRDNIQELIRGAYSLDERDIRELVASPFEGQDVAVFAVVMSDPKNSGSARVVDGRVTRLHFFVRDVAADLEGPFGMGIQVIDDEWDRHGVIGLGIGDVVGITGSVSKSQFGLYLDPTSVDRIGRFDSLGLDPRILAPVTTSSPADLNRYLGDGTFQANWSVVPDMHGNLVCFERAMVIGGHDQSTRQSIGWALSSDPSTRVNISDLSLRFRSDGSNYPPEFNTRSTPFVAPLAGSTVSICGFVVLQAFNDPNGVGRPIASSIGSMLSLAPMKDSDLDVLEVPPEFTSISRPELVLNSLQRFSVSAGVRSDPARSVIRVRLHYRLNGQTRTRVMIGLPGSLWSSSIPAARRDGDFVEYWISALDSEGAEVESQVFVYRALDDGLDSIRDIQETPDGGPGPSPFADLILPMNVSGVIQSEPDRSGLFVLQDDSLARPWSGILLESASVQTLGLQRQDALTIRRGRVVEIDGSTMIQVLEADTPDAVPAAFSRVVVRTEELNQPRTAESLEGMLLRVENASVLDQVDDTTWEIWNGSVLDAIDLSTESPSVSNELLGIWQTRPYIDGIWIQRDNSWILIPEAEDDFGEVINVTADLEHPGRPEQPRIRQTYPNPFSGRTSVEYSVGSAGNARMELFDVTGRLVSVIVDGPMPGGRRETQFDASSLAPGPYILRLTTSTGSDSSVVFRID